MAGGRRWRRLARPSARTGSALHRLQLVFCSPLARNLLNCASEGCERTGRALGFFVCASLGLFCSLPVWNCKPDTKNEAGRSAGPLARVPAGEVRARGPFAAISKPRSACLAHQTLTQPIAMLQPACSTAPLPTAHRPTAARRSHRSPCIPPKPLPAESQAKGQQHR